jgi:hypothetical protein
MAMAPPPGFGGPSQQPNGQISRLDGDFFGQLSQDEIAKKARKWRTTQKKRFDEKRRKGGGAGVDFGKAVSLGLKMVLRDIAGTECAKAHANMELFYIGFTARAYSENHQGSWGYVKSEVQERQACAPGRVEICPTCGYEAIGEHPVSLGGELL